jgi:hypothetical protein
MRAQFDSAMQATAMAQARKDAANRSRADVGNALQGQENTLATSRATGIDGMTTHRSNKMFDVDSNNAGVYNTAESDYQTYLQGRNERNANHTQNANQNNTNIQASEFSARDRFAEDQRNKGTGLIASGIATDSAGAYGRNADAYSRKSGQIDQLGNFVLAQEGLDNQELQAAMQQRELDRAAKMQGLQTGANLFTAGATIAGGIYGGPAGATVAPAVKKAIS